MDVCSIIMFYYKCYIIVNNKSTISVSYNADGIVEIC